MEEVTCFDSDEGNNANELDDTDIVMKFIDNPVTYNPSLSKHLGFNPIVLFNGIVSKERRTQIIGILPFLKEPMHIYEDFKSLVLASILSEEDKKLEGKDYHDDPIILHTLMCNSLVTQCKQSSKIVQGRKSLITSFISLHLSTQIVRIVL